MLYSSSEVQAATNVQINRFMNQRHCKNKLIINNADLQEVLFQSVAIQAGVDQIHPAMQVIRHQEVKMKISKNKIQHYLNQTITDDMNILHQKIFDPVELIYNTMNTCSLLRKNNKNNTLIFNKQFNMIGNAKLYLQAIFSLIGAVLEYANRNIRLRLKAKSRGNNKMNVEFSISLSNVEGAEVSQLAPFSFSKNLNHCLFLVRKMLKKISGQLIVCEQENFITNFVISVNFSKADNGKLISHF